MVRKLRQRRKRVTWPMLNGMCFYSIQAFKCFLASYLLLCLYCYIHVTSRVCCLNLYFSILKGCHVATEESWLGRIARFAQQCGFVSINFKMDKNCLWPLKHNWIKSSVNGILFLTFLCERHCKEMLLNVVSYVLTATYSIHYSIHYHSLTSSNDNHVWR